MAELTQEYFDEKMGEFYKQFKVVSDKTIINENEIKHINNDMDAWHNKMRKTATKEGVENLSDRVNDKVDKKDLEEIKNNSRSNTKYIKFMSIFVSIMVAIITIVSVIKI